MKDTHRILILLLGVLLCETSATIGLSKNHFIDYSLNKNTLRSRRNVQISCGTDFIFHHLAIGDQMNRTSLSILMKQINIGNSIKFRNANCDKCVSADDIFRLNGFQSSTSLNKSDFKEICPALLHQVVSKSCKVGSSNKKSEKEIITSAKAWGFGVLSVTIISLASLLGAFVVPLMNRQFYKKLLLFMVSLAVGVLGGSGLFHLIPNTFGMGVNGSADYLWKCCTVVGGIYFFFITENLMKIYIRFSQWKRHALSKNGINERLGIGDKQEHSHLSAGDLMVDNVLNDHALDSVHIADKNCDHEHGVDSLNMAGDHFLTEKNPKEFFKKRSSSEKDGSFFERVAPVAWMIILGDGLHNFIDGLAIGVAFTSNIVEGISTSLAIFCEELPHELGDFAILLNSGLTYKYAILANFLSACTCYMGLIIGIVLGTKTSIVKWIYALAAGMFLYISLVDMLPEATGLQVTISATSRRETIKNFIIVNVAMISGFCLMLLLAVYGDHIVV